MSNRLIMPLVIAALGAAGFLYMYMNSGPVQQPTFEVLVAKQDLSPATPIPKSEEEALKQLFDVKSFTEEQLKEEAFIFKGNFGKQLAGKYISTLVNKGIPIQPAMINDEPRDKVESKIPEGMRLISVQVDERSANSGLIKPNYSVDVWATLRLSATDGPLGNTSLTFRLFQDVRVLAVGGLLELPEQKPDKKGGQAANPAVYRTISLLLLPRQVALLQHIRKRGQMTYAIKGKESMELPDEGAVKTTLTEVLASLGVAGEKKPAQPERRDNPFLKQLIGAMANLPVATPGGAASPMPMAGGAAIPAPPPKTEYAVPVRDSAGRLVKTAVFESVDATKPVPAEPLSPMLSPLP